MYDRLDAGLLMMAGAITRSDIALKGVVRDHLHVFEAKLQQMGVEMTEEGAWMRVRGPETLSPINVVTTFYPGFPTDLQPGMTALACMAKGDSYIRETVFEDRLGHVKALRSFGARIAPEKDRLVLVHGPAQLKGAKVKAMDIRAGGRLCARWPSGRRLHRDQQSLPARPRARPHRAPPAGLGCRHRKILKRVAPLTRISGRELVALGRFCLLAYYSLMLRICAEPIGVGAPLVGAQAARRIQPAES